MQHSLHPELGDSTKRRWPKLDPILKEHDKSGKENRNNLQCTSNRKGSKVTKMPMWGHKVGVNLIQAQCKSKEAECLLRKHKIKTIKDLQTQREKLRKKVGNTHKK